MYYFLLCKQRDEKMKTEAIILKTGLRDRYSNNFDIGDVVSINKLINCIFFPFFLLFPFENVIVLFFFSF